jgi:hypothetical protein
MPDGSTVEFFGERIRLAEPEDCEFAMLEFAEAMPGLDSGDVAAMGAIMRVLKAAVHDDDLPRFLDLARKNRAQVERDLMPVIVAVFDRDTDRPTSRPSDSSDGPARTEPSSVVDSSSRVIARLEQQGRPDLALVVAQAQGLAG